MTRAEYRQSLRGRRCYAGLDLSSTKDLTALAGTFPDDDGAFDVLAEFFIPKDQIKDRVTRDRVPYDLWRRQGYLTATPGPVVDYEAVRHTLHDWAAEFDLRLITYDPWNATDLVTRLIEQDGFTCAPLRQGFTSLSAPSKYLETAVLNRTLRHDGDVVLRWCLSNVVIERDAAGNIKPSKDKSSEKIDGISALVAAIDGMSRHDAIAQPKFEVFFLNGR